MAIIGLDVDGVLADFNDSYIVIMEQVSGIKFPPLGDVYPECWDYDKAAGLSQEQISRCWKYISGDPTFWISLKAYPEAVPFLQWLNKQSQHEVYFMTSRPGIRTQWQTEV